MSGLLGWMVLQHENCSTKVRDWNCMCQGVDARDRVPQKYKNRVSEKRHNDTTFQGRGRSWEKRKKSKNSQGEIRQPGLGALPLVCISQN